MNAKRLLLAAAAAAAALLTAPAAFSQWHHPHGWARPYPHFVFRYGFGPRYYPYPWFYGPPYYAVPLYGPPPVAYAYRYYEPPPAPAAPAPQASGQRQYSEVPHETAEVSHARIARVQRTVLSARELFAFDKAKVRGPIAKLDEIAETMKREPAIDQVRIVGYTDRIGSKEYNQKLSERRAESVREFLVKSGLPAEILSVQGHGKSLPLVPGTSEAARAKNRRVELGIVNTQIRYGSDARR